MPAKWDLTIDGKSYKGTKLVERYGSAKYLVPVAPGKVMGFTTDASLLGWATRRRQRKLYEKALEGAEKARREWGRLSDTGRMAYEKKIADRVKKLNLLFDTVLAREGVKPNQADRILKLAKAGKIKTLYLYKDASYRNTKKSIDNANAVPDLHSLRFGDKASSAINASSYVAILWQNKYYWGVALLLPPWFAVPAFGWFNDRASSISW